MVMRKKTNFILGKPLIPNAGVRSWYTKELDALVKKMDERTRKRVLEIFEKAAKSGGNVEAQERMALNELNKYYAELFKRKANGTPATLQKTKALRRMKPFPANG